MALLNTLQIAVNHNIQGELAHKDYGLVPAAAWVMPDELRAAWAQLQAEYEYLPADRFLPDGGVYRYRRYDSFRFDPQADTLELLPHETYFQDTDINAVTGGIIREFAPLTTQISDNPFLQELIRFDFNQFPTTPEMRLGEWQVDVHLIRVIARAGEAGHPTPEGVHRDGAEFVTVHLAELDNVVGGEVSIYDDAKNHLESFTLCNVLDAYSFRDSALWHGVTPVRPAFGDFGMRSILTFDYHFIG